VVVIATGTFHSLAKASGSNLCARCLTTNITIPIWAYADTPNARISLLGCMLAELRTVDAV
jgi:hypothetical protein